MMEKAMNRMTCRRGTVEMPIEIRMLDYLQNRLTNLVQEAEHYGRHDKIVIQKIGELLGCKDMVEAMICQPINLHTNGVLTVGFNKMTIDDLKKMNNLCDKTA